MSELHLKTVAAGLAPGGIWVRVCSRDRLLREYSLTDAADSELEESAAAADADLAMPYLELGEDIFTYFYDGDSGACLRTLITKP